MASKPDFTRPCIKSETKKSLRSQLKPLQEKLAQKIAAGDTRGVKKINEIIANLNRTLEK
mgnify:CR=1 FL=1